MNEVTIINGYDPAPLTEALHSKRGHDLVMQSVARVCEEYRKLPFPGGSEMGIKNGPPPYRKPPAPYQKPKAYGQEQMRDGKIERLLNAIIARLDRIEDMLEESIAGADEEDDRDIDISLDDVGEQEFDGGDKL